MKNNYDVMIIGGGIGGLFAAYNLRKNNPSMKIAILDKGKELEGRKCPATNGKACVHCKVCAITSGIAGSGAFSDAKFNIGTAYGGTLAEELGENTAMRYIEEVDKILESFSENYPPMFESNEELKLKCIQNNLQLLDMNVRHLGTDKNFVTMQHLIAHLRDNNVEIYANTSCEGLYKLPHENNYRVQYVQDNLHTETTANKIIVATGRGGADFVKRMCQEFNIEAEANSVDIGVRVEMKDIIWKEFSSQIYEPKIL